MWLERVWRESISGENAIFTVNYLDDTLTINLLTLSPNISEKARSNILAFTCSKSTMETAKPRVISVQSSNSIYI